MHILPKNMRSELKEPFGKLYPEWTPEIETAEVLITVGDACSVMALEQGAEPKLMIYDNMIERHATTDTMQEALSNAKAEKKTVTNAAGTITEESIQLIKECLESEGNKKIEVEGEEDLLVIPCILLSPVGTHICYGQPGEGLVLVKVDQKLKEKIQDIIERMEVR